ncbi:hypothetical protein [Tabrizicola piscis]|nr:hypothetical protein [Tabrizicola piscis]
MVDVTTGLLAVGIGARVWVQALLSGRIDLLLALVDHVCLRSPQVFI